MRVQPPEDMDRFVGKVNTKELIIDYIGSHQVFFSNRKKLTIKELVDEGSYFYKEHVDSFYKIFPLELKEMADTYIRHVFSEEVKEDDIK